jgi:hypothetical protein
MFLEKAFEEFQKRDVALSTTKVALNRVKFHANVIGNEDEKINDDEGRRFED